MFCWILYCIRIIYKLLNWIHPLNGIPVILFNLSGLVLVNSGGRISIYFLSKSSL